MVAPGTPLIQHPYRYGSAASWRQSVHWLLDEVMSHPPDPVGFVSDVTDCFVFLKDWGFVAVPSPKWNVRYESRRVFIEVSWNDRDGEVAIEFGRLETDGVFSYYSSLSTCPLD